MRKITLLMLIFAVTNIAKASLFFSVNGENSPPDLIVLAPSNSVNLGLWGDGSEIPNVFYIGIHAGDPGMFEIDNYIMHYQGNKSWVEWEYDSYATDILQVNNPCININLNDVPYPGERDKYPLGPEPNPLVDNIIFRGTGIGYTLVTLFNADGLVLDSLTFYTGAGTPEPATIALFGLGTLILRRKK